MIRLIPALAAMMAIATAAHGQTLDPGLLQAPVDGSVASWIIRTFGLLTVLVGRTRNPDYGYQFSALYHRFRDPARRDGAGNHSGQYDPGQPCAFHDILRYGADL
jgi:hypothetical protein